MYCLNFHDTSEILTPTLISEYSNPMAEEICTFSVHLSNELITEKVCLPK